MFPVDARFQSSVHRLQEVVAVRLDMKADQVRSQQSVDQLALPGADRKRLGIRPWDMPENRHARVRPFFLQHSGQ